MNRLQSPSYLEEKVGLFPSLCSHGCYPTHKLKNHLRPFTFLNIVVLWTATRIIILLASLPLFPSPTATPAHAVVTNIVTHFLLSYHPSTVTSHHSLINPSFNYCVHVYILYREQISSHLNQSFITSSRLCVVVNHNTVKDKFLY